MFLHPLRHPRRDELLDDFKEHDAMMACCRPDARSPDGQSRNGACRAARRDHSGGPTGQAASRHRTRATAGNGAAPPGSR
jgi:hypothetical protein